MSDTYERSRVLVALEQREETRRIERQVRRELDSLYRQQATEAYGRSGSGGTSFGSEPTRSLETMDEDTFVSDFNEFLEAGGHLGTGTHPGKARVDAHTARRTVEHLLPQLQRAWLIKYGWTSPMRQAGEP